MPYTGNVRQNFSSFKASIWELLPITYQTHVSISYLYLSFETFLINCIVIHISYKQELFTNTAVQQFSFSCLKAGIPLLKLSMDFREMKSNISTNISFILL